MLWLFGFELVLVIMGFTGKMYKELLVLYIIMDSRDYLWRINTRIPEKELEECKYDYQCTRCLSWKKVNDFGVRSTGRIYRYCIRCREVVDKARRKRIEKKDNQKLSNEEDDKPVEE